MKKSALIKSCTQNHAFILLSAWDTVQPENNHRITGFQFHMCPKITIGQHRARVEFMSYCCELCKNYIVNALEMLLTWVGRICVYAGGSVPFLRANVIIEWFHHVFSPLNLFATSWKWPPVAGLHPEILDFQENCSFKWQWPWKCTEKKLRKPKTDGRRVNDEKRTSRRLRTTVSAHHVVFSSISLSVCLSPLFLALFTFLLISLLFFLSLLLFLTPPSLPLCTFLALLCLSHTFPHFSVSTAVSLQRCTSSLDRSFILLLQSTLCIFTPLCV